MPGQGTRVDGTLKAFAVGGGELLAAEMDRMATEGGVQSLHAKLSYLTDSVAGQEAMIEAGIDLTNSHTRNTVRKWLSDEVLFPPNGGISTANAQRVEAAYVARRRETMASRVKARLQRGGGAFVEVSPPDQSRVDRRHRRDLGGVVRIRILDTTWAGLVDQWEAGQTQGMQHAWEDICEEQLYPPAAFYNCGDIQIAA